MNLGRRILQWEETGEYKRDDEHVGLGKVVNYYLLELALLGFGGGSGGG